MERMSEFKIKKHNSVYLYKLNHNLWFEVDFNKYRDEAIKAVARNIINGVYEKRNEDETGTQGLWDLANDIVSKELGYLESMMWQIGECKELSHEDFSLLVEDIYDELKEYAYKEVIKTLKGENNE